MTFFNFLTELLIQHYRHKNEGNRVLPLSTRWWPRNIETFWWKFNINKVERLTRTSQCKVWCAIRRAAGHPYHYVPIQGLNGDFGKRVEFCRFILNSNAKMHIFLCQDLDRKGGINFHSLHYWAEENPRLIRETSLKKKFSENVWIGVIDCYLIGHHFFLHSLNGLNFQGMSCQSF